MVTRDRFRRAKQAVKSWLKRLVGIPQPTAAEIHAARDRCATGQAGAADGGDPGRDHLLARGWCCEKDCRQCPWGHRRR
jgi:hypothetical protein